MPLIGSDGRQPVECPALQVRFRWPPQLMHRACSSPLCLWRRPCPAKTWPRPAAAGSSRSGCRRRSRRGLTTRPSPSRLDVGNVASDYGVEGFAFEYRGHEHERDIPRAALGELKWERLSCGCPVERRCTVLKTHSRAQGGRRMRKIHEARGRDTDVSLARLHGSQDGSGVR